MEKPVSPRLTSERFEVSHKKDPKITQTSPPANFTRGLPQTSSAGGDHTPNSPSKTPKDRKNFEKTKKTDNHQLRSTTRRNSRGNNLLRGTLSREIEGNICPSRRHRPTTKTTREDRQDFTQKIEVESFFVDRPIPLFHPCFPLQTRPGRFPRIAIIPKNQIPFSKLEKHFLNTKKKARSKNRFLHAAKKTLSNSSVSKPSEL